MPEKIACLPDLFGLLMIDQLTSAVPAECRFPRRTSECRREYTRAGLSYSLYLSLLVEKTLPFASLGVLPFSSPKEACFSRIFSFTGISFSSSFRILSHDESSRQSGCFTTPLHDSSIILQ